MIRVLAWVGLFLSAAVVTLGLGLCLLIAPERVATFLHEYFVVFPPAASPRARSLYRALGAALVLFASTYGLQVVVSALRLVVGGR